ncbi:MAG: RES family NAD+ phosphorylase [Proteobacteria bacterium]|nr:RES family NAD+ phosphorylase [Pseudomonadota bacterium]
MLEVISDIVNFKDDVFRNTIGIDIDKKFNPFDDLSSDPSDWQEAERAADIKKIRFTASELQLNAIDYIFSLDNWDKSRFGDGSFAVWYGSMGLETTFYETAFHLKKFLLHTPDLLEASDKPIIRKDRTVFRVFCHALSIDLRAKMASNGEYPDLVDQSNYQKTQEIAVTVYKNSIPAIISKSVRYSKGTNIAVFNKSHLSNPLHYHDYYYEFDLNKELQVSVYDMHQKSKVLSI